MSHCTPHLYETANLSFPEIRVNGVLIDEALYAQELQYHQAETLESALQKVGQALVIRQLLMNETGDDAANDEEAAIQLLVEQNSSFVEPSEDDCRRYFENNSERFKTKC